MSDNIRYENGTDGHLVIGSAPGGEPALKAYGSVTTEIYKQALIDNTCKFDLEGNIESLIEQLDCFRERVNRLLKDGCIISNTGNIIAEGERVIDILYSAYDTRLVYEFLQGSPIFGGQKVHKLEDGALTTIPVYIEISDEDETPDVYWILEEYFADNEELGIPIGWRHTQMQTGNNIASYQDPNFHSIQHNHTYVRIRKVVKQFRERRMFSLFPKGTFRSITSSSSTIPVIILPGALDQVSVKYPVPTSSTVSRLCLVDKDKAPITNQNLNLVVDALANHLKMVLRDNSIRTSLIMAPQYTRAVILDLISAKNSE